MNLKCKIQNLFSQIILDKFWYLLSITVISPDFLVRKFCRKAQFRYNFERAARNCRNCAFPQNFHTTKSGEFTVFFAMNSMTICIYLPWKVKPGDYTWKKTGKNNLRSIYLFACEFHLGQYEKCFLCLYHCLQLMRYTLLFQVYKLAVSVYCNIVIAAVWINWIYKNKDTSNFSLELVKIHSLE